MSNSYRIRTQVGVDKFVQVKLDQDFEQLDILSFAIFPNDIYTRNCPDFGVVCGRVFCNKGFGLPNARLSIFIPISDEDELNPVISTLYPYKSFEDFNEDGYKYNLLPYTKSHSGHVPVGTFPEREDVLIDSSVIEVYDKYYKFTVKTNESGDFMIFGVPVGQHNLFMQIDLSDIGEFSLTPQDLIRIGRATEGQVNGATFKFSENYSELPQIVTLQKIIQVAPFYGQPDVCDYYIVRADFDLTTEAQIKLEPTAVFMGSLISTNDRKKIKRTCKVPAKAGWLCDLITGPGQIETVRQTVNVDSDGRPILEQFRLDNDGKLIDDNGTWVVEVPMNLDYVYTDENGNRLISDDPTIGIPTKGKYRFKIKWQQSPELSEENKRGYFLVPNIKEYGWDENGNNDPSQGNVLTADITLNSGNGQLEQSLNNLSQYYAININNFQNIQSYEILVNDVVVPDFQTTIPFGTLSETDDVRIRYILIDGNTDGTLLNVRLLNEGQWLQQSSYAFSLSWTDYGNELMIEEAINCDDRFYELQYNKVYTVSQLLDRVTQQSFPYVPQKSIQIKHITDSKCEGDYNPFPTNDVYYRYDFLYIALNFILTILKFVFIPLVVVVHILAFLWPVLASIILIIQGIIWLVVQICEGINSVANLLGLNFDCPQEPDLSLDIFNQNPFKNIMLPLILYTDDGCERCRCRIGNVDINDNEFLDQLRPILTQLNLQNTSSLADLTSNGQYEEGLDNYNLNEQILLAGSRERGVEGGECFDRLPFYESEPLIYKFSTSLQIQERLNLFNTKAKYFDEPGSVSPGDTGWNQIKITWQPDINNPNTTYHYDNTMVLLIDNTGFTRGDIITFQDPLLSNDPNVNITSGVTNIPNSITVKYAHPTLGQGESFTTYSISENYIQQTSSNPQVSCYPSDIEYFQVLDIVNWSTFIGNRIGDIQGQIPDGDSRFSLPWRFLDTTFVSGNFTNAIQSLELSLSESSLYNKAKYGVLNQEQPGFLDQLNNFSGINSTKIMILQRGVDVNSPKIKQRIDLSRLYGYSNYDVFDGFFVIEDYFKMNIPIQPGISEDNPSGLLLPRHNEFIDNNTQSIFGYDDIFYESYMFSFNDEYQNGWTTNMPNFYSALDSNSIFKSGTWNTGCYGLYNEDISNINNFLQVEDGNYFTKHFVDFTSSNEEKCTRCFGVGDPMVVDAIAFSQQLYSNGDFHYYAIINSFSNGYVSGYEVGEYVEGGSYMVLSLPETITLGFIEIGGNLIPIYFPAREINSSGSDGASCDNGCNGVASYVTGPDGTIWIQYKKAYVSPVYAAFPDVETGDTDYVNPNHSITFTNKDRIVFRTDRLPSSTTLTTNQKGNGYLLHQNPNFAMFKISEDCNFVQLGGEPAEQIESVEINYDNIPGGAEGTIGQVQNSLTNCSAAVDLNSYYIDNDFQPGINSEPPYSKDGKYLWFVRGSGCYNLVSRPILSLLPRNIPGDPENRTYSDIALVVEWVQRIKLNMALCFEVFSHTFSNNWINGTLYAYSFQNTTFFDSENQPFRLYCKDNLYFNDSINNYFYRSSPYDGSNFVGKSVDTEYGNKKNLLFPTTILDMGPKVEFIQELVSSDDYDGYIINQIPTTTFKNVTDILNLFVLSRLINSNFIQLLIPSSADDGNEEGGDDPSVGAFFANNRWQNGELYANGLLPGLVDADYSQLISITSELGITEYSPENYSSEATIFVPDDGDKSVLGLLLSGNTQQRDFISPRRTIWNQNAIIPGNIGDFTYILTKSQEVPFYQWNIDFQNNEPTIFGYQSNNYVTDTINFFSSKYQELDRFNPSSEYFTPDGNLAANFRGYIINFDNEGNPTEVLPNSPRNRVTFGAPYHFYFGLKQGASAMDRFITKYVNTEETI